MWQILDILKRNTVFRKIELEIFDLNINTYYVNIPGWENRGEKALSHTI